MNNPGILKISKDNQDDTEIDISNINNINRILFQVKYEEILKDYQKKIYKKKKNDYFHCLCNFCYCYCKCKKIKIKYQDQLLKLFFILFSLIILTVIFRISQLNQYKFMRNDILINIKILSLGKTSSYLENLLEIKFDKYDEEYIINEPFSLPNPICDYKRYINGLCTKLQYENETGCNYYNYRKKKCNYNEYKKYCNKINFDLGYCNLTEHEIYLCLNNVSNQIYCNNTVRSDYQYDSKDDTFKIIPGYIIDYSLFQFFCDYKNYENTFLITSLILLFFL